MIAKSQPNNRCALILSLLITSFAFFPVNAFAGGPVVEWHTFLGSAGDESSSEDISAMDAAGNMYVVGFSTATWGTPVNAHTGNGENDIFVAKVDSNGTLLWNTFLGGTDYDGGYGIFVDASTSVFITGESGSSDWGVLPAPVNAHSNDGQSDIFVAKLDSSGALIWHTFLGSDVGSDNGDDVSLDAGGNIYVTGDSTAEWGAPVIDHAGGQDVFVARLNSSGVLLWNTFMGSGSDEWGAVIDLSGTSVMVMGSGRSWGMPVRPHAGGNLDVFVAMLNTIDGAYQWHSYLGGGGWDFGVDMVVDAAGNAYVVGNNPNPWGNPITAYAGDTDIMVAKLNSSGVLQWHTFLGSAAAESGHAVTLDGSDNIYVAGRSEATWGDPVNPYTGDSESLVVKLNPSGQIMWHTFMGSPAYDEINGINIDAAENIFVAGRSEATWGSPLNPYADLSDFFVAKMTQDAARVWSQVYTDGFGDVNNTGIQALAVYNNRLYASTSNPATGCQVWEFDGANWAPLIDDGFGDPNNWHATAMAVHNNRLYVGTYNDTDGAEVWEYDGANWSQFNLDGFGDSSTKRVSVMAEYNGNLYAGTYALGGGEVWEYFNATWSQVNSDGFGDISNTGVHRMAVYNDNLYVGTDQAEVWQFDGAGWTRVNTDGFGDSYNWDIYGLAVFNGNLYAGTYNETRLGGTGGEVWAYDGAAWNQVNTDGFGNSNNVNAFPSIVFNDRLYVGTGNETDGGELWEYDGEIWTLLAAGGFDDVNNQNIWNMVEYGGNLYAGTFNDDTGAEVCGFVYKTQDETENNPPNKPMLLSPPKERVFGEDVDITLRSSAFNDPDGDETHLNTKWKIMRADTVNTAPPITSSTYLTEYTLSSSGLSLGLKYVWQVQYVDTTNRESPWSNQFSFKVGTPETDKLPAVKSGNVLGDFGMISIVHWPNNPDPEAVFNIEYNRRNYRIGTWDPDQNRYIQADEELIIEPGRAYWILCREDLAASLNGIPVSKEMDIDVKLTYNPATQNGWNMIAPPNDAMYYWEDVQVVVYDSGGQIIFGPQSILFMDIGNPFIDIRLWCWEDGIYHDDANLMEPYSGYWTKAKAENVYLRFAHDYQVSGQSRSDSLWADLLKRTKRWAGIRMLSVREAIAGDNDTPPMPMGLFEDSVDPVFEGCFVQSVE